MAKSIDYASLRDQTLGSGQEEEAVTVNTRALIDKVLARYSGEWTTLRELIQNAADASASKVVIKFETLPSSTIPTPQNTDTSSQLKHVILNHTLKRLLVSNDGQPFNENDWSRLKRIAEGNPDETKIGAFGVGFYSVFADCENPFITSGSETMAFYWKGNSLFTRRGKLSSDQASRETCFVLDQRNTTSPVPSLISICQFLSTSLTFVGLEKVELWLDDWKVFELHKRSLPALDVAIPKDIETKSKEGMMKIAKVESHNAQVDASWMNVVGWTPIADKPAGATTEMENKPTSLRSFFSRMTGSAQSGATAKRLAKEEEAAQKAISADLTGNSKVTVFLRVSTVHVKSQVSNTFAAELERATKKVPPKQTKISILTSSYDETSASMSTVDGPAAQKVANVVTSIIPTKHGRIFIGFPTAQTTGLLAHISAPSLIPTVERENIDLNARYVRSWNSDLLDIAGKACRIAYIDEMSSLRQKTTTTNQTLEQTSPDHDVISSILPAAIHALKQFTFQESHPLSRVGQFIEESFWTCSKSMTIEIPSSRGILPSHEVRIASEDLSFVNRIPVVPESLLKDTHEFISRIQDYGLLSEITPTDIKNELDRQPLSEDQLLEFLKWASQKIRHKDFDTAVIKALFAVTTVNINRDDSQTNQTALLLLKNIKAFLNSSRIPPELPTPPHSIPHRFTKGISNAELQEFGWEELQLVPWLRWLLEQAEAKRISEIYDMTRSAAFAAQVLAVLSKSWDTLSQSSKSTITEILAVRTVMPTKAGMKTPPDSYFPSVKLFDDLPILQNVNNVKEKFLKALGVRKTIELQVIFERLMTNSVNHDGKSGWSHVDLIKYLVSVWNDIPEADMTQLRNTALCPAEKTDDPKKGTIQRFKLSELFEPRDVLRSLELPILQWPQSSSPWNSYSSEGKFLRALGLKQFPSVPELVTILAKAYADQNMPLYERALKYFLENHYNNNYTSFNFQDIKIPFLPLEKVEMEGKHRLAFPSECYADLEALLLGFPVLRQDLQPHASKFGVQKDPLMSNCAARLMAQPPKTTAQAKKLFGYFAKRHADISGNIAEKLGSAPIVPIFSRKSVVDGQAKETQTRYVPPNSCFLGDGQEYGEIFDYVDFGPEPNVFLLKVGSKHEPSIIELSQTLIRQPSKILKSLGVDKYRNLLRKVHLNMNTLKKEKVLWKEMKIAAFLLASKDDYKSTPENVDDDISSLSHEWHLRSARNIVIVDDLISFNLFRQHILAAPQDESLEDLYWALGTPQISTLIDEEARLGPQMPDQKIAHQLRQLLLERVQLFLHEQNTEALLHDLKWLEKNLEVQLVQSVSLRRTLRGSNHSNLEKRTAFLNTSGRGKAILSITAHYETWEVSQAAVSLLLKRPKTQSTMVFETFLTTSLIKLRNRGYNVDRILRRKAAEEARIAEAERQKQEQEERKRQEERVRTTSVAPLLTPSSPSSIEQEPSSDSRAVTSHTGRMPGSFGDSPEHGRSSQSSPMQSQAPNRPRGLFSSITRHLGFEDFGAQLQSLQGNRNPAEVAAASASRAPTDQQEPPPPYSPQNPRGVGGQMNTPTVLSPHRIDNDLRSAVQASRSHGSSELVSQARTNSIQEVASYCDSTSAQNLQYIGETSNPSTRMRFYLSRDVKNVASPAAFLSEHSAALDQFASVLLICAAVFSISRDTMHIFYDEAGHTIAFNRGGSIFFNFRFFSELHHHSMDTVDGRTEAVVYWWVTLCHELAHNLVEEHSARHSFYTESFVQKYFPTLSGLLAQGTSGTFPR